MAALGGGGKFAIRPEHCADMKNIDARKASAEMDRLAKKKVFTNKYTT